MVRKYFSVALVRAHAHPNSLHSILSFSLSICLFHSNTHSAIHMREHWIYVYRPFALYIIQNAIFHFKLGAFRYDMFGIFFSYPSYVQSSHPFAHLTISIFLFRYVMLTFFNQRIKKRDLLHLKLVLQEEKVSKLMYDIFLDHFYMNCSFFGFHHLFAHTANAMDMYVISCRSAI